MLFKKRDYDGALKIFKEITKLEKFNIDALNSIAYCTKFSAASKG